jgi:hypothetical protein
VRHGFFDGIGDWASWQVQVDWLVGSRLLWLFVWVQLLSQQQLASAIARE